MLVILLSCNGAGGPAPTTSPSSSTQECSVVAPDSVDHTCIEATHLGPRGYVQHLDGVPCLDESKEFTYCQLHQPLKHHCGAIVGTNEHGACSTFSEFVDQAGWLQLDETAVATATVLRCDSALLPTEKYDWYTWDEDRSGGDDLMLYANGVYFDELSGEMVSISRSQVGHALFPDVWCCAGVPVTRMEWGEHARVDCAVGSKEYSPADF